MRSPRFFVAQGASTELRTIKMRVPADGMRKGAFTGTLGDVGLLFEFVENASGRVEDFLVHLAI